MHRLRFATLAKQEKMPTVLPPQSAHADITNMELTEMDVTSVYLDTYDPVLRELRDNLHATNEQYVKKSISFLGLRNASAKKAQERIHALAAEVDFVSDKLSSFCKQVNNASNDNFNILFQNLQSLTTKLENENISKQQIIEELKDQQQLVSNMQKDINTLQVTLENTKNELQLKNTAYDNILAQFKEMQVVLESTESELKVEIKEYQKLSSEFKGMETMAQNTKTELEKALNDVQGLETNVDDLKVTKTKLRKQYKRRVFVSFVLYTMMMVAVAAWFYLETQQEAEQHIKKLERKKESLENFFLAKQKEIDETLRQKEEEMNALQKQLTDANNRGLWSYIFGY